MELSGGFEAVAIFVGTTLWLGGAGSIDGSTVRLFIRGLPALLAGTRASLTFLVPFRRSGFSPDHADFVAGYRPGAGGARRAPAIEQPSLCIAAAQIER